MESILVGAIVACAAIWAVGRVFRRRRGTAACGSSLGCAGTGCTAKPQREGRRLVRLRR